MRDAVQASPAFSQPTSVGRTASRWLRRQMWRHKAAQAPVYVGCGLWVGSGMGHLAAPGSWWLSVPLGASVTVCTAGLPESWHEWLPDWALHVPGWIRSEYERRYAGAVGVAGTVWLAVDWWHGPTEPLTLALVVGSLGVGTARLWHRRIRHDSQVRRLRVAWKDHLAERAKLPGSVIQSIKLIPGGRAIRLRLAPGQTVDDVRRNLGRVISALSLRPRSSQIEADAHHPRRCTILVREVDVEPVWRHNGREIGRPAAAAVSIVTQNDDEYGAEWEDDATPRLRLLGTTPQVAEMPRPHRLEEGDPLLAALQVAPAGGLTVQELVDRGLAPRTTAFRRVKRMVEDGSVVSLGEGRYRAAVSAAAAVRTDQAAAREADGK